MSQVSKSENFLAKVAVMIVAISGATVCIAECSKPAKTEEAVKAEEADKTAEATETTTAE
ncbi:MAG: hypothetical protein COY39_05600 [Alphaproteobacteria bacterium CG_4_10_14_0_8_um_filter_37_21]|nr:MAG: hypothetical protein COY39_05600 [Alphaproteobacteria bacterium CG_4_10_14_0_8_um_filter_37_21]